MSSYVAIFVLLNIRKDLNVFGFDCNYNYFYIFIFIFQGKLIKLFSRQLVNKAQLPEDSLPTEMRNIPRLAQWLQVVGLSEDVIKVSKSERCFILNTVLIIMF